MGNVLHIGENLSSTEQYHNNSNGADVEETVVSTDKEGDDTCSNGSSLGENEKLFVAA